MLLAGSDEVLDLIESGRQITQTHASKFVKGCLLHKANGSILFTTSESTYSNIKKHHNDNYGALYF